MTPRGQRVLELLYLRLGQSLIWIVAHCNWRARQLRDETGNCQNMIKYLIPFKTNAKLRVCGKRGGAAPFGQQAGDASKKLAIAVPPQSLDVFYGGLIREVND
jgi:hypothetical protein